MCATRRVSQIAGGSTTRESRESRQLSTAMATAVPITVVALEAKDVAVEVTTDCMPPMSFISRDWTSPPLVRVKKPSDWRCRWVKTAVRRPCMTRWPTVVDSQVWTTPKTAVSTVTASMPPTAHSSSGTSCRGDRVVDDQADQERRGQGDHRGGHDQGDHDGELAAVGAEERGDPAPADRGALELGRSAGSGLRGRGRLGRRPGRSSSSR